MNPFTYRFEEPLEVAGCANRASATVSIKGNEGFIADHFQFAANDQRPHFVLATQSQGLAGGVESLGVALRIFWDQDGNPAVQSLFALVDSGSFLAQKISHRKAVWDAEAKQLLVVFGFDFRYAGEAYTMAEGSLVFNF